MWAGGAATASRRPVGALSGAARRRRALPARFGKRRRTLGGRVTLYLSGFGAAAATPAQRNGAVGRGGRWLSPGAAGPRRAAIPGGLPPAALWLHTARRGNGGANCCSAVFSATYWRAVGAGISKLTCMMAALDSRLGPAFGPLFTADALGWRSTSTLPPADLGCTRKQWQASLPNNVLRVRVLAYKKTALVGGNAACISRQVTSGT